MFVRIQNTEVLWWFMLSPSLPFTSSLSCRWSISFFSISKRYEKCLRFHLTCGRSFFVLFVMSTSVISDNSQHRPCFCARFCRLLDSTPTLMFFPSACADNSETTEFWVTCLSCMILCVCGREIWYLCVGSTVRFYSSGWSGISLLFSYVKKFVVGLQFSTTSNADGFFHPNGDWWDI